MMPDVYLDQLDVERRRAGWERNIADTEWPRSGTLVATEANGNVVGFANIGPARDGDGDPLVIGELRGDLLAA